jgi:DNA repair ATPase RecN
MANTFESLVSRLKDLMNNLNTDENLGSSSLFVLLLNANLINGNIPDRGPNSKLSSNELKDILSAFQSQSTYTLSTISLLNNLSPSIFTLDTLKTATNLIQIYFQVTQPLEQILSDLVDNLESLSPNGSDPNKLPSNIEDIKGSTKKIIQDRKELLKEQNKILREFEGEIDEQNLQDLLRNSSEILSNLQGIQPTTNTGLDDLLQVTHDFIGHLQKAQELFKTFSRQGEAIRDSEAGEVEQLIRNWRDAIKEIERLELNDDIKEQLNKLPDKSRQAIAQSIQIHELLEANYGFLSDLIRSGDLVSPGVL